PAVAVLFDPTAGIGADEAEKPSLRIEAASGLRQQATVADLRDEPRVGAEVVARVLEAQLPVRAGRVVAPVEPRVVRGELPAIPFRRERGQPGRLRVAPQELARDRVLVVRAPLEIGTEDPVVAAAFDLPAGQEEPAERGAEIVPNARDSDARAEFLGRQVGRGRAGQDDEAAAAI